MANKFSWYNGYSPQEREYKLTVLKSLIAKGELPPAAGSCALCGDPEVPVEYHDEDYGEPFIWVPPAMFALCRDCHRDKLHGRFWRHSAWQAFLAHVRRGGYARDLKEDPLILQELDAYRASLARCEPTALKQLRSYTKTPGTEWFATLRMDIESRTDPKARIR